MRLAWLTLGLAPVVLGSIVAFFWVQSNVPRWVYWKVGLILLIMAEIAYVLALTFAIPGTLLVGAVLIDRRRKRQPAFKIARWFLLGMSVLLALAMAEVAGVMLKRLSHPASALPPGDLAGRDPATRIAMAPAEIELPTRFPEPPGDRKLDVVVMGESSRPGIPYQNWLSIGQLLKWQLGEILPDRPIRVEVLALSGEDLEQQHHRLARIVRRPDLLIVYCGHNEFSARFHAMRDLGCLLSTISSRACGRSSSIGWNESRRSAAWFTRRPRNVGSPSLPLRRVLARWSMCRFSRRRNTRRRRAVPGAG